MSPALMINTILCHIVPIWVALVLDCEWHNYILNVDTGLWFVLSDLWFRRVIKERIGKKWLEIFMKVISMDKRFEKKIDKVVVYQTLMEIIWI